MARIKRHNKILDQLRIYVSKYGWTSYIEPRLVAKDGTLWKPDIIFRKEQRIALVDVTVRYEDNNMSLEKAWDEKRLKYSHLGSEIMELTGGSQLEHFGFVLGARGKWLGLNNTLFTFLGIKRYVICPAGIATYNLTDALSYYKYSATGNGYLYKFPTTSWRR
ncbi:hypothetical protein scyTo_0020427 [Scyliorhinus torazame]|uniref:Uncharacterized protein n=1 Tax=Scyliorhinus torazame TaxID=75743 RepID=A0A401PSB3_SCYTO|nr:hypothetical protein [Scyliorhinus torazame]